MDISTEIYHLQAAQQYEFEKPYTMRYVPVGATAFTNVVREKHDVTVSDMRGKEHEYSLDEHGFMILSLPEETAIKYYDNHEDILTSYLPELEDSLLEVFPHSTIDFVSYLIRKREAAFPHSTGQKYSYGQPNIVAHVDVTPDDLVRQIVRRYGVESPSTLSGRVQYITAWKPLRGPLYDYPLALCDKRSVVQAHDLEAQDIVDRSEVFENFHVYHRPQHRWYYLQGQQDHEILVFRQADTRGNDSGVPHCAINNPQAPSGCFPRESIEVVAFVRSDS